MWTIVADDILWNQDSPASRRVELKMGGRFLVLDVDAQGRATVSRLVSSDPQDYMNPRWQPGVEFPSPPAGS